MKNLCKCGKIATWVYMPSSSHEIPCYCDECVPRGCSCNINSTPLLDKDIGENPPESNLNWKWIEFGKQWCYVDEKGREYPCIEYWYDEEGFDDL